MSLYKPKASPFWHYDFRLNHLRFYGSTGTANRASAKLIEGRAREKAALGGGRCQRQPMTLNTACGRYYAEIAGRQPSRATTDYQLAGLIAGLGRETTLAELTDNEIAGYVSRRRGRVADASVNRETQLLKRLFRRADAVWRADIGDMPNWREHILQEPEGRTRELGAAEEARLIDQLRPDFLPLVEFTLATAARLANARMLTWSQVDYHTREITFRLKSRKPGGRRLIVPITNKLLALLAAQRGHHPIYVFTFVCKRGRGKRRKGERYPFSQSGWRRQWAKALAAAGIEDFRFHDLRHSAATRMLRATGNLKVVQQLLGHADIATTARYAHAATADVRVAMEAVESRNNPEIPKTPRKKRGSTD